MRSTTVGAAATRGKVPRVRTGLPWLDAVLGGGFARGSVVMVHAAPGRGKSTMLAQAASGVRGSLYASAEESDSQVADRCVRLGLREDMGLICTDRAADALDAAGDAPLVVLDSVQKMVAPGVSAAKGSPRQVVAVADLAVEHARSTGACVVLVCHETKGGRFAGPRTLEHAVDVSLWLDDGMVLSAKKNRHGATDQPVQLEMTAGGVVGPGGLPRRAGRARGWWRRRRLWLYAAAALLVLFVATA